VVDVNLYQKEKNQNQNQNLQKKQIRQLGKKVVVVVTSIKNNK
jgi:hypothetical protein